jgi:hypothetical protein
MKRQILALLLGLVLIPFVALAQEKKGTVDSYDEGSRMVVIKGKDWEQKAKVSSSVAKEKADLLKAGTKVTVDFDDRGGGDVRVKALSGR